MASTPPIPSVGAIDEVSSQFNLAKNFGSQSFAQAFSLIGQLTQFTPQEVSFDTSFTIPDALLSGFVRPERPTSPESIDFDVAIPDIPSFSAISIPTFDDAPTFTKETPALDFSGRPAPFAKLPPTIPELFPVSIPDAPTIALPELPTLQDLNLPEPPDIVDHEFVRDRPTFTTPVPDGGLDYAYTEYSSELLDEVTAEVSRVLKGGTGLPPAIEQAIFDRARDREDVAANQAKDEVTSEFAARGFTLPSGIEVKRLKEVQQANMQNRSGTNRELAVTASELEIDNLRFAIQQGIALENLTSQLHQQAEEIKLRVASLTAELALSVFDAQVALYNAQVQAYQVDATVFRELIEAELTKVERFRAEIEAQRVKGEINQQQIDLYVARLQGLNTLVAIYTSEVEAANTVAATNETIIRGFGAEIEAFRSEVDAKQSEFAAWAEQIRGELGKVDGFRAETQAFTARTQAYAAGVEAKAIAPRLSIEQQALQADQYRAQISGVQAQIDALSSKAQAIAQIFSGEASIYAAEGQVSTAEAESNTRQFLAKVEQAQITAQTALAEAELRIQKILGEDNQIIEALRGASQATSQLAAASFSAVNASASIGESGSASNSWAFSETWTKDTT